MSVAARKIPLRLVDREEPFREEIVLPLGEDVHSLHGAVAFSDSFPAVLAEYLIGKYSAKGEAVLDPCCGSGVVAFQSALMGRIAYAADVNPLFLHILRTRLDPADLADVTLKLGSFNLRRPVDLDPFHAGFREFFEIETYREVVNLRQALVTLRKKSAGMDRAARFIEMVTSGILHGHSASYLSVYTFPQVSLSTEAQANLNTKRRQNPEYRAVLPRVLRRTAAILRDGLPSCMSSNRKEHRIAQTFPSDLSFVDTSSVGLVCLAPVLPEQSMPLDEMWLRAWFLGVSLSELKTKLTQDARYGSQLTYTEWLDYCNGLLLEAARVLGHGGRCVLKLKEKRLKTYTDGTAAQTLNSTPQGVIVALDQELADLVARDFARYFEIEGFLLVRPELSAISQVSRDSKGADSSERVLVLRRK